MKTSFMNVHFEDISSSKIKLIVNNKKENKLHQIIQLLIYYIKHLEIVLGEHVEQKGSLVKVMV